MSRISTLLCVVVVLSTSLVVTHAQYGGRGAANAALDAANADVRSRALEVERLVLAAAAAEEAAETVRSAVHAEVPEAIPVAREDQVMAAAMAARTA